MAAELVLPTDDPIIVDCRAKATAILAEARAVAVDTPEARAQAVEVLSGIARVKAEVEKRRIVFVKPFNDHVRTINDVCKTIVSPLDEADRLLRDKVLAFNREEQRQAAEAKAAAERARLEAEAKLQEAARAEAAGRKDVAGQLLEQAVADEAAAKVAAQAPVPARAVKTDIGAASTVKRWTFKVVELTKVPATYLQLDTVAVRRAIAEGTREIPGLEIFQEEGLAVRR